MRQRRPPAATARSRRAPARPGARGAQVRVPTNVVSSICDDRGEEPTYAGVTMSALIEGDFGVGDVISLLWFKRALPKYATRFIEMCVMLCADHGPCVSGAPRLPAARLARAPGATRHVRASAAERSHGRRRADSARATRMPPVAPAGVTRGVTPGARRRVRRGPARRRRRRAQHDRDVARGQGPGVLPGLRAADNWAALRRCHRRCGAVLPGAPRRSGRGGARHVKRPGTRQHAAPSAAPQGPSPRLSLVAGASAVGASASGCRDLCRAFAAARRYTGRVSYCQYVRSQTLLRMHCRRQDACDKKLDADEYVENMKKSGIRVPGIGHRIKSKARARPRARPAPAPLAPAARPRRAGRARGRLACRAQQLATDQPPAGASHAARLPAWHRAPGPRLRAEQLGAQGSHHVCPGATLHQKCARTPTTRARSDCSTHTPSHRSAFLRPSSECGAR
jgi:hypothetical protein